MSKVMTMKEAISKYVKSGDTVFLSGCQHGEPSAAIHEIVRQKIDGLTIVAALVANTSLLVGEGLVSKLLTGFFPQNEDRSYALQKARETKKYPVIEEYSHFGLAMSLLAGQMGVPFMPMRSQTGSDMSKYNKNIGVVEDPFGSGMLGAVKATVPDVGIFHCQKADAEGTAQKWGSVGIDQEGVNASKTIIVTTEQIVDSDVIRRDPNRTLIPGFRVTAVVEQPWGAHPMHLAGCYNSDPLGFMRTAMADKETYETYMKNCIYGVNDWAEFLEERRKTLGEDYFTKLAIQNPKESDPIITGY